MKVTEIPLRLVEAENAIRADCAAIVTAVETGDREEARRRVDMTFHHLEAWRRLLHFQDTHNQGEFHLGAEA